MGIVNQTGNFGIGVNNGKSKIIIKDSNFENIQNPEIQLISLQLIEIINKTLSKKIVETPLEKLSITKEVLIEVEKEPNLKTRLINAVKSGSLEALKELINHPVANILMASIDGWKE